MSLNTEASKNPVENLRWSSFGKIVNSQKPLTIFSKNSIVDAHLGSKYTSELLTNTG